MAQNSPNTKGVLRLFKSDEYFAVSPSYNNKITKKSYKKDKITEKVDKPKRSFVCEYIDPSKLLSFVSNDSNVLTVL